MTEPRIPCYDLTVRFDCEDVVRRCLSSGRIGAYFRVEVEGTIEAGDCVRLMKSHSDGVAIKTINLLYVGKGSRADYDRALSLEVLPESWRSYFEKRGFTNHPELGV